MALLEASGVTKQFGGLTAVDTLNFVIEPGSMVSIIGPNGAGKTTFFNTLTGIYRPERGKITFDGKALVGRRPDQITRLGIARTFQNIRLFGSLTVTENILVGMHPHLRQSPLGALFHSAAFRKEEQASFERARQLMRFVGLGEVGDELAQNLPYEGRGIFPRLTTLENLEMGAYTVRSQAEIQRRLEEVFVLFPRLKERLHQKGGTLSGGEQQMLATARGLMMRPKILLLDEPSMGLAPVLVETIFDIIRDLNRREGTTILLVEQNALMALRIAARAYVIETGQTVISGTGPELLDNEQVKSAYLGI